MIDGSIFTWAFGFLAGATTGFWWFWLGVRWRRFPYSSAANAPTTPVVLEPVGDEGFTYLVMPVQVRG